MACCLGCYRFSATAPFVHVHLYSQKEELKKKSIVAYSLRHCVCKVFLFLFLE